MLIKRSCWWYYIRNRGEKISGFLLSLVIFFCLTRSDPICKVPHLYKHSQTDASKRKRCSFFPFYSKWRLRPPRHIQLAPAASVKMFSWANNDIRKKIMRQSPFWFKFDWEMDNSLNHHWWMKRFATQLPCDLSFLIIQPHR